MADKPKRLARTELSKLIRGMKPGDQFTVTSGGEQRNVCTLASFLRDEGIIKTIIVTKKLGARKYLVLAAQEPQ